MKPRTILTFALGPLGAASLGLLSVPLLAWVFSAEDIGRISILQLALNFCFLLFGLGLDQAYVREFYESDNKNILLLNTFAPGLLLTTLVALPFLFNPTSLSSLLFDIKNQAIDLLIIISIVASFFLRFFSLRLRLQEQAMTFSLAQILPKAMLILMAAFFAVTQENPGVYQLTLAYTISIVATLLFLLPSSKMNWSALIKQRISITNIIRMLAFSGPLIMGGVAYWGLISVDKLLLKKLSSFSELGVYSVAMSFAAAASVFQSIFGSIWSPLIYRKLADNSLTDEVILTHQRYVIFFGTILFCLSGILSWAIEFLLPPNYANVKYLIAACMATPIFYTMSEVTGIGIGISKKTGLFMSATVVALVICYLLNMLLIPQYGARGAAASTCAALWLFFIFKTEISAHLWKSFPRVDVYLLPGLCLGAAIVMAISSISSCYIAGAWGVIFILNIFYYKREAKAMTAYCRKLLSSKTQQPKGGL